MASGASFMTGLPLRARELTSLDALKLRRRKLVQIGMLDHEDTSEVHFEECVVFHCFYGDDACDEPADPNEFCLKAAEDGSCADPLCRIADGSKA